MSSNAPFHSSFHRDRVFRGNPLGAIEPIPDVLLSPSDLRGKGRLSAGNLDRPLQCSELIHSRLYTPLGVSCLHPLVFVHQQLSCYPIGMAKKSEKTKKWDNWQDTRNFPERVVWARNRFADPPAQLAIAKLAGIAQQSIAKAEAPGAGGSSYTAQIAAALGVSAHWLATGEGEPFMTLKDIPTGAIDISIAILNLHPSRRDHYLREILKEALAFLPTIHPRYKGIEAMYMELASKPHKARETVELQTEAATKSRKAKTQ